MAAAKLPSEVDLELDLPGLICPVPVLRTRKALAGLARGQRVRVSSTDPGSEIDLRVLAEVNGHKLLEFTRAADRFVFVIEKG